MELTSLQLLHPFAYSSYDAVIYPAVIRTHTLPHRPQRARDEDQELRMSIEDRKARCENSSRVCVRGKG